MKKQQSRMEKVESYIKGLEPAQFEAVSWIEIRGVSLQFKGGEIVYFDSNKHNSP